MVSVKSFALIYLSQKGCVNFCINFVFAKNPQCKVLPLFFPKQFYSSSFRYGLFANHQLAVRQYLPSVILSLITSLNESSLTAVSCGENNSECPKLMLCRPFRHQQSLNSEPAYCAIGKSSQWGSIWVFSDFCEIKVYKH